MPTTPDEPLDETAGEKPVDQSSDDALQGEHTSAETGNHATASARDQVLERLRAAERIIHERAENARRLGESVRSITEMQPKIAEYLRSLTEMIERGTQQTGVDRLLEDASRRAGELARSMPSVEDLARWAEAQRSRLTTSPNVGQGQASPQADLEAEVEALRAEVAALKARLDQQEGQQTPQAPAEPDKPAEPA